MSVSRLALRIAVIAYWLVLTAGLLWPRAEHLSGLAGPLIGDRANLAHFLAFLVLGLGVHFARLFPNRVWSVGSLLIYGLTSEIGQALSPGRTPNLGGALANVLGVVAGLGIVWTARHVWDRLRIDKARQESDRPCRMPA